jgi:hypothetical protein
MIPRWLVDKRTRICLVCDEQTLCTARWRLLHAAPDCPLKRLPSLSAEVAAKAWPEGAEPVSGCCDSAQNYLPSGL